MHQGRLGSKRKMTTLLLISCIVVIYKNGSSMLKSVNNVVSTQNDKRGSSAASSKITITTRTTTTTRRERKIAIISGYVQKDEKLSRLPDHYMDHLLNKACYAHRHKYDLIFNVTWGYPNVRPRNGPSSDSRLHHLDSGTWHAVPYMEAALPKYDWVLLTDADYIFQRIDISIDHMINKWETGMMKKDVHVLVPPGIPDGTQMGFPFPSWAILIRNSLFGHRVLHYWKEFALGVFEHGNFGQKKYSWKISDQPALWYALIKAHMEHFANVTTADIIQESIYFNSTLSSLRLGCDPQTGYLQVNHEPFPFMKEMNNYFGNVFENHSHSMADLFSFPRDQPILWSSDSFTNDTDESSTVVVMGLGIDVEPHVGFWHYQPGITPIPEFPKAFGLHVKSALSQNVLQQIQTCREELNCTVGYFTHIDNTRNETALIVKCGNQTNQVF
mmetsp:Transcript_4173/g.7972  ORF Transcript_4173/g.7972 Transcript_4173/m.7972 type:complete len:443 (-) Transcript_4173:407-1735(-)